LETFSELSAAIRLLLGFAVAGLVYFAVLLAFVASCKPNQPMGGVVDGVRFAIATLLAVIAGTLVSPKWLSRIIIRGVCALSILFPLGVSVDFAIAGTWHAICLLYLLGSIGGGYAVARPASGTSGLPRPRPICQKQPRLPADRTIGTPGDDPTPYATRTAAACARLPDAAAHSPAPAP
jgi:hypothetical protein